MGTAGIGTIETAHVQVELHWPARPGDIGHGPPVVAVDVPCSLQAIRTDNFALNRADYDGQLFSFLGKRFKMQLGSIGQ